MKQSVLQPFVNFKRSAIEDDSWIALPYLVPFALCIGWLALLSFSVASLLISSF